MTYAVSSLPLLFCLTQVRLLRLDDAVMVADWFCLGNVLRLLVVGVALVPCHCIVDTYDICGNLPMGVATTVQPPNSVQ